MFISGSCGLVVCIGLHGCVTVIKKEIKKMFFIDFFQAGGWSLRHAAVYLFTQLFSADTNVFKIHNVLIFTSGSGHVGCTVLHGLISGGLSKKQKKNKKTGLKTIIIHQDQL